MLARALPLALLLAMAPVQCTKKPDPERRMEESGDDGVWALAEDFKAKGNQEAYLATLRFLVTHYPGSRRAAHARDELEGGGKTAPASAPSGG